MTVVKERKPLKIKNKPRHSVQVAHVFKSAYMLLILLESFCYYSMHNFLIGIGCRLKNNWPYATESTELCPSIGQLHEYEVNRIVGKANRYKNFS